MIDRRFFLQILRLASSAGASSECVRENGERCDDQGSKTLVADISAR